MGVNPASFRIDLSRPRPTGSRLDDEERGAVPAGRMGNEPDRQGEEQQYDME